MRFPLRPLAAAALVVAGTALAQGDGETIFQTNCAACHQASGQGVPGAFPPLAGHVPELLAAEQGRTYLMHVVLFGLQGEIQVAGQTFNGMMPSWSQFSDEQLAAVLNFVATAWENEGMLPEGFEPFTAEEVAAERELGLTPEQVHEQRGEVVPPAGQ